MENGRRVRILINPKSGIGWSTNSLAQLLEEEWGRKGVELTYQYSASTEDGIGKARRAVEEGVDAVLVVGGDGMVNSIGGALVGSDVALGVVPAGSGNGFARHFGIPLAPEKAVPALYRSERITIDVGTANERPFFVTCSMAWDAALVRTFDKSPVRGVLPYVFAAAYEFLEYKAQPFEVVIDGSAKLSFDSPQVFTIANLSQFGGGAQVAPHAQPDDGYLELVVISRRDVPRVLRQLPRLFDGTIDQVHGVQTRQFRELHVKRQEAGPIQLDGELLEAPAEILVRVMPKALNVLVPRSGAQARDELR